MDMDLWLLQIVALSKHDGKLLMIRHRWLMAKATTTIEGEVLPSLFSYKVQIYCMLLQYISSVTLNLMIE
jgi:hypothetical protein